jgi:hypothetical protein
VRRVGLVPVGVRHDQEEVLGAGRDVGLPQVLEVVVVGRGAAALDLRDDAAARGEGVAEVRSAAARASSTTPEPTTTTSGPSGIHDGTCAWNSSRLTVRWAVPAKPRKPPSAMRPTVRASEVAASGSVGSVGTLGTVGDGVEERAACTAAPGGRTRSST